MVKLDNTPGPSGDSYARARISGNGIDQRGSGGRCRKDEEQPSLWGNGNTETGKESLADISNYYRIRQRGRQIDTRSGNCSKNIIRDCRLIQFRIDRNRGSRNCQGYGYGEEHRNIGNCTSARHREGKVCLSPGRIGQVNGSSSNG
jgi:hypothetical protein